MGPALERLLARPSALRLLRSIVSANGQGNAASSCVYRTCHSSASRLRPHRLTTTSVSRRRGAAASTLALDSLQHKIPKEHAVSDQPELLPDEGATVPSHRHNGTYLAMLISWYTGAPLLKTVRNGEDTFDTMIHEANVTAPSLSNRARLVDHPDHAQNMALWLELLRFRKRLHGHAGVRDIWSGMMERNLDLPVSGQTADALWSIFISAAFSDPALCHEIYAHAKHLYQSKGLERPHLYQCIVGGWLRADPSFAVDWHETMQGDAMAPLDAAAQVFEHALRSRQKGKAFTAFKEIYRRTNASSMYDSSMSSVCELCDFSFAFRWHAFFLKHNDLPTPAMMSKPIINHLFAHYRLHQQARTRRDDEARRQYDALQVHPPVDPGLPVLTRESMSALVGDVHGIKQKKIGDAFCARLFATGAFSIDLVVTGLRMLGLEALGALAMREIAARASSPSAYLETVRSLENAGISIIESTFTRALKNFAEKGNADYFNVVVQGDRHPDTYGDTQLQRRLFRSFLTGGKVLEAHTTLAILAMSELDPNTYSWNLLLQTYARTSDRPHVVQILQEMRLKRIAVSESSLNVVFHKSLGPRRRGKRPVHSKRNDQDVDFVSGLFLTTLRTGSSFDQTRWREILRRYGMTKRLMSLERLVLWLAAWHSTRLKSSAASVLRFTDQVRHETKLSPCSPEVSIPEGASHPLAQIFSGHLLRSIIAWGFMSSVPPFRYERAFCLPSSELPRSPPLDTATRNGAPETWARGISLVRKLQDYGVDIHHPEVLSEVKIRLWMLFGPGKSSKVHNRLTQQNNKQSLLHYVQHIEDIWGGEFFSLPRGFLDERASAERKIYSELFSSERRFRRHQQGTGGQQKENDQQKSKHFRQRYRNGQDMQDTVSKDRGSKAEGARVPGPTTEFSISGSLGNY